MVLFLHNRYRTTGGEERVVRDLMWLVREELGETAELLERESAGLDVAHADVVLVPSVFARERLRALGAPLPWERVAVLAPPLRDLRDAQRALASETSERYALVVSRLAVEKGVDVAIDACRIARMPLVVAGAGPERQGLQARAAGADVRFLGRVDDAALAQLRSGAAIALAPSRSAETFGLAVAEA